MEINLGYPSQGSPSPNVEFMIAEPGGNMLLDTIVPTNTDLHAELATDAKLVDLTFVLGEPGSDLYVFTYRGVDPSTWKSAYSFLGPQIVPSKTPTRTTITYTDIPAGTYDAGAIFPYWFSCFSQGVANMSTPIGNPFLVQYDWYPGNYAYLLLPKKGLYKLSVPTTGGETVSLATMDTAVRVHFTLPAYLNYSWCNLSGMLDTTDLTNSYHFYSALMESDVADALYPNLPIQKFLTFVNAVDQANTHSYTAGGYLDSIPLTPDFFHPEDWHINSETIDNFSISFPAHKPSYYETQFSTSKVHWTVISSSDSTSFHPLSMLQTFKGIKMKDEPLTGLLFQSWTIYNINNYNYADYLKFAMDPATNGLTQIWKFQQVTAGAGAGRIGRKENLRLGITPNDKW